MPRRKKLEQARGLSREQISALREKLILDRECFEFDNYRRTIRRQQERHSQYRKANQR